MKYFLKRSKRKTLSMHFSHDGELIVNAPMRVSQREIDTFVNSHLDWIEGKLREYAARPRFADGDRVELMGEQYTISPGPKAILQEGVLYLPADGREQALIALLRKLTRQRMKVYLDEICKTYGFSYTKLSVTSARGRWGSCTARGHISFSFRGAFLPDRLAYYLAVHELCHTRSMDHSPRFWAEVKKILPDYHARRMELKKYLWAMNCLS